MEHEINPVQIDLLKNELKMNGIDLDALFERYPGFIESLVYGLFTPPHESRMPEWVMFFLCGEKPADGAVIINESGKVLGGNVHLAYRQESAKAVKAS